MSFLAAILNFYTLEFRLLEMIEVPTVLLNTLIFVFQMETHSEGPHSTH